MTIPAALADRAQNGCELCAASGPLSAYHVSSSAPRSNEIAICNHCAQQLASERFDDTEHWRALGNSMWSSVAAVQVMCWRILVRLRNEAWAQDLLDMLYLDDELLTWAKDGWPLDARQPTVDCNGVMLQPGDAVTVVKDLDVKGANFTAKRGTVVRNISLSDNSKHIEGRVNGTKIVLLTCYVKKSG